MSNTKYSCYDCQRLNSLRKPTGEAKITCRGCRREYIVPSNITIYRCPACQVINTSIAGYGQSNKESGIHMIKPTARNLQLAQQRTVNKNAYLQNFRSSPFTGSSLILSRRCNKRAVLCGISYKKTKFKLEGTINDVMNMKELLVKIFDFPNECIRVLTEEAENFNLIPTKKNMLESLKWLVEDCQPEDSLVFYFSGHGSQLVKEDETDGFDECICPVDSEREGIILDNEINSIIVWPLREGVTLHAIVDACHSGTVLDLTNVDDPKNCKWKDNKPLAKEPLRKHTSGGLAICLGACKDSQMATDTTAFPGKGMNGVMTYLFTKIIRQNPDITYEHLLAKMEQVIKKKFRPTFLQHVFCTGISQILSQCIDEKGVKNLLGSDIANTTRFICPKNQEFLQGHRCATDKVELIDQCPVLDDYVQRSLESLVVVEKAIALVSQFAIFSNLVNHLLCGKVESSINLINPISHTLKLYSSNY